MNGESVPPSLSTRSSAPAQPVAARTRMLLEAPVLATLLRLAAPNVLNLLAIAGLITFDGLFIGRLGPDALAGVSLAFPWVMLAQHTAASGMGGGVSSAIARALGGGRRDRADALASHAFALAVILAAIFSGLMIPGAPLIFHWMGGRGEVLAAALALTPALPLTFALAIAAVLALPVALPGSLPGFALAASAARGVFGGLLGRRSLLLLLLQLTHHFSQPRELLRNVLMVRERVMLIRDANLRVGPAAVSWDRRYGYGRHRSRGCRRCWRQQEPRRVDVLLAPARIVPRGVGVATAHIQAPVIARGVARPRREAHVQIETHSRHIAHLLVRLPRLAAVGGGTVPRLEQPVLRVEPPVEPERVQSPVSVYL